MCRFTYHCFPDCGHVSTFTMASCASFTNHLRLVSPENCNKACAFVQTEHELLPRHHCREPCLQCRISGSSSTVSEPFRTPLTPVAPPQAYSSVMDWLAKSRATPRCECGLGDVGRSENYRHLYTDNIAVEAMDVDVERILQSECDLLDRVLGRPAANDKHNHDHRAGESSMDVDVDVDVDDIPQSECDLLDRVFGKPNPGDTVMTSACWQNRALASVESNISDDDMDVDEVYAAESECDLLDAVFSSGSKSRDGDNDVRMVDANDYEDGLCEAFSRMRLQEENNRLNGCDQADDDVAGADSSNDRAQAAKNSSLLSIRRGKCRSRSVAFNDVVWVMNGEKTLPLNDTSPARRTRLQSSPPLSSLDEAQLPHTSLSFPPEIAVHG